MRAKKSSPAEDALLPARIFYISSPETLREETDILPALRSQNLTSFMIFSKAPALFLT